MFQSDIYYYRTLYILHTYVHEATYINQSHILNSLPPLHKYKLKVHSKKNKVMLTYSLAHTHTHTRTLARTHTLAHAHTHTHRLIIWDQLQHAIYRPCLQHLFFKKHIQYTNILSLQLLLLLLLLF